MNLPFYFAVVCAAVVSLGQQVAYAIIRALRGLLAGVQGAVSAGRTVSRAAWRHPFVAGGFIVTTTLAWLLFGWVPLLSAFGLTALLLIGARLIGRLFRRMKAAPAPQHPRANPQRNGQRMNSQAVAALDGVS